MKRTAAAFFAFDFTLLVLAAGCASPGGDEPPAAPQEEEAPLAETASSLPTDPLEVEFRDEAATARARGLPILIEERRYAGGDFSVRFYNVSGREIDEIVFELAPYSGLRKAGGNRSLRFTGPMKPSLLRNDLYEGRDRNVWAEGGDGIGCIEISTLRITFGNEEEVRYGFNEVSRMYQDGAEKWCRYGS